MNIATVREDETLIVKLNGRIDGNNAAEIHQELESALSSADRALILDMGGVSYMSSAGLRIVALMFNRTRVKGVQLALCSLSKPIENVLATSGFNQMMVVVATLDEARASVTA